MFTKVCCYCCVWKGENVKTKNIKSKLIKPQEEINGIIEETLEEDEMNITDLKNLIQTAATIVTLTLSEVSGRNRNRNNVSFWKIRMPKQISSWRKSSSIIAETGTVSDFFFIICKRSKFFFLLLLFSNFSLLSFGWEIFTYPGMQ